MIGLNKNKKIQAKLISLAKCEGFEPLVPTFEDVKFT